MNTKGIDFEMGMHSVGSQSDLSLNQLTKLEKEKNNIILNGEVEEYRASAKGALAQGAISSTGTNSPSQVFYGNQFFVHVF